MNRRASDAQMALPGVAPLCPHCGGRRTELVAASDGDGDGDAAVTGQQWCCRGCERTFWSLPSLASGGGAGPQRR